jgi:polyferredoxin
LQGGKTHLLRPRLIGYVAVLLVMIGALVLALVERPMVSLDVTKDRGLFRENARARSKTSTASRSSTRPSSARTTT